MNKLRDHQSEDRIDLRQAGVGRVRGQWVGLTGVKGAAGPLRRVKHAADIRRAGGSGGRRRGQGRAGGVGGGDGATLGLAVGDPAVADLAGLVLQGRWVPHGAGPGRGGPDPRGLEGAGVLFHLEGGEEQQSRQPGAAGVVGESNTLAPGLNSKTREQSLQSGAASARCAARSPETC